jgi:hypothetical protein
MTVYTFTIKISSGTSREARRELKALGCIWIGSAIRFMLDKGLRYVPTVVLTAKSLSNCSQELLDIFEWLRQRTDVKIIRRYAGTAYWEQAIWPPGVLEIKEVNNEITRLAARNLLSKDNSEDAKLVRNYILSENVMRFEDLTVEQKVNIWIDDVNEASRKWSNYFLKALDIHRRYPTAKFWFYVQSPG